MRNTTPVRGVFLLMGILFLGGGCGVPFSKAEPCCHNPPTSNGCGAEGARVWTSEVLDCFNVSLFGTKTMSFRPACDIHDRCYGTAYSNKFLCDLEYFFELNRLCQTSGLGVDEFIVCTGRAAIYTVLVGLASGDAYAKGQVDACRCIDIEEDGMLY